MRRVLITAAILGIAAGFPAAAQTVYPVDRAEILAGSRFDFKVEFPDRVAADQAKVTLNGVELATVAGRPATHIEREEGREQSALLLRDLSLPAGSYAVSVTDGARRRDLSWTVYETAPRKARNVILFIGDGMSLSHRIAARHLSKGIVAGKSAGKLAMDDMPHMALVATAGSDSIITDSANAASAYATGHKAVLIGGGAANFLPQGAPNARRRDDVDFIAKFRDAGYATAATAGEMNAAAVSGATTRLLGLFASGNMDGVLDRKFLKAGTVKRFPDQPDLTEQVSAALTVLSRSPQGFFLMVESGMIDKYTHLLDMERAVYDTIMLDNAVKLARQWAEGRDNDTLILVTSDHSHPVSLIGTVSDGESADVPLRERIGVYDKARFPNYPAPNAEGYPDRVDVSRRLAMFSASSPDYVETFRPRLDGPNEPTTAGKEPGSNVPNERYCGVPGAMLRVGNLPKLVASSVHSAEDVILTAIGPGSEQVRGQIDNTEVFRIMADALGLGR
jgi:alkaline phosphatase